MSKVDLISNAWCDLVFEGRNQAYGAYRLRKGTAKRNILSIIIVLIAAVVIFSAIAIKNVIQANQKVAITTEVELSKIETKKQAKVEKKAPVKIEQPKPVEKVKSSIKFTAPVIKKDEDVKPEEEMKNQDELQKTKTTIGAFNVVGNDDIVYMMVILDYKKTGNYIPMEMVENTIRRAIVNKRLTDHIHQVDDSIYRQAMQEHLIKINVDSVLIRPDTEISQDTTNNK